MSSDSEVFGHNRPGTNASRYNELAFVIAQTLAKLATAQPVIVIAQRGGGLAPVGFVDVQPLVQQLAGDGTPVDHGIIPNVPYFRLQGGDNAVVIDPKPGDIGMAAFSSRDMTAVKNARQAAPPGSRRQYDMSDAMYFGGLLNGTPTQYVQFSDAGITMHSPTKITLDAPDIVLQAATVEINASTSATITTPTFTVNGSTVLNGPLSQGMGSGGGTATMQGPLTVTNNVTGAGISLNSHHHTGVTTGAGNTGGPV